MRISTLQIQHSSLRVIDQHRSDIVRAQEQISSGSRINRPSDDPVGAARIAAMEQNIDKVEQFQRNTDLAFSRLGHTESALAEVSDLLQHVRELTLQAASGVLGDSERELIAIEVRQVRDRILAVANEQDDQGGYLFAGYRNNVPPFAASAGGVTYRGDQGVREIALSEGLSVRVSESGSAVFQSARNGNGSFAVSADNGNLGTAVIGVGSVTDLASFSPLAYRIEFTAADTFDVIEDVSGAVVLAAQPYVDSEPIVFGGMEVSVSGGPAAGDSFRVDPSQPTSVFDTLDALTAALEKSSSAPGANGLLTQSLQTAISDLDGALQSTRSHRASVGTRLQSIQAQQSSNEFDLLQGEVTIGDVAGLDYAEAISRMASAVQILESAQQSFVRIQGLSLFRLLR